jgi:hypothetical protein
MVGMLWDIPGKCREDYEGAGYSPPVALPMSPNPATMVMDIMSEERRRERRCGGMTRGGAASRFARDLSLHLVSVIIRTVAISLPASRYIN